MPSMGIQYSGETQKRLRQILPENGQGFKKYYREETTLQLIAKRK